MPEQLQRYRGDGETGLALRMRARGGIALYHPGAAVKHVIPASRLTPESFERKGFCQGVSRSYSDIRLNGLLTDPPKHWRDYARRIKWKVERAGLLRDTTAGNIRFLVSRARFAGRAFHRKEVSKDPKLLEWVIKSDYFDYRLPDGWKNTKVQLR
jgi:hypothetical protein